MNISIIIGIVGIAIVILALIFVFKIFSPSSLNLHVYLYNNRTGFVPPISTHMEENSIPSKNDLVVLNAGNTLSGPNMSPLYQFPLPEVFDLELGLTDAVNGSTDDRMPTVLSKKPIIGKETFYSLKYYYISSFRYINKNFVIFTNGTSSQTATGESILVLAKEKLEKFPENGIYIYLQTKVSNSATPDINSFNIEVSGNLKKANYGEGVKLSGNKIYIPIELIF